MRGRKERVRDKIETFVQLFISNTGYRVCVWVCVCGWVCAWGGMTHPRKSSGDCTLLDAWSEAIDSILPHDVTFSHLHVNHNDVIYAAATVCNEGGYCVSLTSPTTSIDLVAPIVSLFAGASLSLEAPKNSPVGCGEHAMGSVCELRVDSAYGVT